jgi:hypothetical protein
VVDSESVEVEFRSWSCSAAGMRSKGVRSCEVLAMDGKEGGKVVGRCQMGKICK